MVKGAANAAAAASWDAWAWGTWYAAATAAICRGATTFNTFLINAGPSYVYNCQRLQDFGSTTCGYYSTCYILLKSLGYSIHDIVSQFSYDLMDNDRIVQSFYSDIVKEWATPYDLYIRILVTPYPNHSIPGHSVPKNTVHPSHSMIEWSVYARFYISFLFFTYISAIM